jgi:hypothetical protein
VTPAHDGGGFRRRQRAADPHHRIAAGLDVQVGCASFGRRAEPAVFDRHGPTEFDYAEAVGIERQHLGRTPR